MTTRDTLLAMVMGKLYSRHGYFFKRIGDGLWMVEGEGGETIEGRTAKICNLSGTIEAYDNIN